MFAARATLNKIILYYLVLAHLVLFYLTLCYLIFCSGRWQPAYHIRHSVRGISLPHRVLESDDRVGSGFRSHDCHALPGRTGHRRDVLTHQTYGRIHSWKRKRLLMELHEKPSALLASKLCGEVSCHPCQSAFFSWLRHDIETLFWGESISPPIKDQWCGVLTFSLLDICLNKLSKNNAHMTSLEYLSSLQWRHNGFVYSTVYSGADQRKHQSSASLAFVRGMHRWPVNSPHKWPVTRKMLPFDDAIMMLLDKQLVGCWD